MQFRSNFRGNLHYLPPPLSPIGIEKVPSLTPEKLGFYFLFFRSKGVSFSPEGRYLKFLNSPFCSPSEREPWNFSGGKGII
jgi:hypothetical protein